MGVKNKPMNFQAKKLAEFRNHDPERSPEETSEAETIPDPVGSDARITKTVRMRERFGMMLKEEAYRRSMKTRAKVSEADLLDEALSNYQLKLQKQKD